MATATETLGAASYVSLATFRRDGREVRTPVWVARDGEHLYVFSEAKAGKVKRLRNDSRVRVAACDMRGRVHGAWQEGTGRRLDSAAEIDTAYRALRGKYGWQMRMADFFSRLSGRYDQRAILELRLDE
jgi:PPOX class probable F420-dependent enzyme